MELTNSRRHSYIDIKQQIVYYNNKDGQPECPPKRRNKMVYRYASSCGAFWRGCAAVPQTGVGRDAERKCNREGSAYAEPFLILGGDIYGFTKESSIGV